MKTTRKWWWLLVIPVAALALLTLSGCNSDESSTEPKPSVTHTQPYRREKIEPMDEKTGELARRHVYDELDREIETHISFRNGERASYYFRDDGKAREYVLRAKNGDIRTRKVYAADGQTVIEGKESRPDGTCKWILELQKDGSSKTTTYWYDGKRPFSVEIKRPDGTFETTYFRKSGSLWMKKSGTGSKIAHEEHFDRNSVQTLRIETPSPDVSVVTVYNNGKAVARQTYKIEPTSWGSASHTLQTVEELDANGKVTRKLKMNYSGWTVEQTETFNADGSRTVKDLRWDGTVKKEETFDSAGKSTKVTEYKENETVTEPVDRSLLQRSYPDNPENSWGLQEVYPYYRDRDE